MIKKYMALIFLALPSFSFGMKQTIEQGPGEHVLEQLRKESSSYVNALPRELVLELRHFADDQIRQAIESSPSLQGAIEKLRELAELKIHARYFKDLKALESIINALAVKFNESPDRVAEQLNMEGAARWLKEVRPQQVQLIDATAKGDINTIKQLIAQHVNPNTRGHNGDTPLIIAARKRLLEIAQYLIQNGADINAQNTEGNTALIEAILYNHPEIVRLLLEHDADTNKQSKRDGFTALTWASDAGYLEIIKLLLDAGANPDLEDYYGNIALDYAQERHHGKIAKILKDVMAKKKLQD